jgi:hypothetical protein
MTLNRRHDPGAARGIRNPQSAIRNHAGRGAAV